MFVVAVCAEAMLDKNEWVIDTRYVIKDMP